MKDVFSMKNSEINNYFDEFILKYYDNFKFNYNWCNYENISIYLKKLIINSITSNKDNERFINNFNIYIKDVEDFFVTGIYIKLFNINNIDTLISRLNKNVKSITYLECDKGNIFSKSVSSSIQIKSKFKTSSNSLLLDEDDIRRIYLFREFSRNILDIIDLELINNFCSTLKVIINEKGANFVWDVSKELVLGGFLMIEEALSQELAEILVYYRKDLVRPKMRDDEDLGCYFRTNFDSNGLYQDIVIKFGTTIRGCGEAFDDPDILKDMISKCINKNFSLELISEFYSGNAKRYVDLCKLLHAMGNIVNEKYALVGERICEKQSVSVTRSYKTIEKICSLNQDFRTYPLNGYKVIDFSKYM